MGARDHRKLKTTKATPSDSSAWLGTLDNLRGDKKPRVQWETFESTMGFSIDKHITDYFSKVDISEAPAHKTALEQKQDETSKTLQKFVTKNYTKFIHISNEITNIETDMSKLTSMWGNYRDLMKQLQKTSFNFSGFSEGIRDDNDEGGGEGGGV